MSVSHLRYRLNATPGAVTAGSIEWRGAARADLLEILDYISDDNPDAAQRLIDEIEVKVSRLASRPKLYRPGRVAGTREMVVRPNYIVVYAEDEQRSRTNLRRSTPFSITLPVGLKPACSAVRSDARLSSSIWAEMLLSSGMFSPAIRHRRMRARAAYPLFLWAGKTQ